MKLLRQHYRFPFNHYPAMRLALLLMAGILAAQLFATGLKTALMMAGAGFFLAAVLHIGTRRTLSVGWSHAALLAYLLCVMLLGFGRATLQHNETRFPPEQGLALLFEDESLRWFGRLEEQRLSSRNTLSLFMQIDSVKTTDGLLLHSRPFRTQIRYFRVEEAPPGLADGAHIALTAAPSAVPARQNPHDFDVAGWLASMDIYVQAIGAQVSEIQIRRQASPLQWSWWRARLHAGIDQVFAPEQAPLAKAIMLGYKAGLDENLRQDFSRAGLAHLMAVSGMHVGFVLFPLWLLIPIFWRFRYGRVAGLGVIVFVLVM
ncbi:MAG: ComEC/Rec2 family competence protein, partial [Cyclonatronaceae bacterium]